MPKASEGSEREAKDAQKYCFPNELDDSEKHVNLLIDQGDVREALAMAMRMIARGSRDVMFEVGSIHERGGPGIPIDLERAIHYYTLAASDLPCSITAIYLARCFRKVGDFERARKWITEAESYGTTARIHLGWGIYHEEATDGDLRIARRHFMRAAVRGRFHGFNGCARVSREMGQRAVAHAFVVARVLAGPLIALLIGRRARETF